jgi:cytochrome c oxidase accessory protein FixG
LSNNNLEQDSFRDHLSTVTKEGKRIWVYPKRQKGRFYTARTIVSIFLLAFLFIMPWIKVSGHPFMLLNFFERRFIIFGVAFNPQDFFIFALGFVSLIIFVVLFTAIFGRIFCGWVCPQTVFMEMVYRKIEYWIEGDAKDQRALNERPMDGGKFLKKSLKQIIFIAIAVLIGNTFMAYLVGIDETLNIVSNSPSEHLTGFIAVMVFSGVFYFVFSYFREQACTIVCPYGRLQGVLLDPNSIVVAYDYVRGEPRGKLDRENPSAKGDCIDCHLCVAVCPTEIDIRNGTQLECINCTSCIDACDSIMDKIDKPRGLIRYDSMKGIKEKRKFKITPRIILYSILLVGLLSVFGTLLASRADMKVNVLRAPGKIYQEMPDDKISNLYHLKMVNNTFADIQVEIKTDNPDAEVLLIGKDIVLKSLSVQDAEFMIIMKRDKIKTAINNMMVRVFAGGKILSETKTTFIAPAK